MTNPAPQDWCIQNGACTAKLKCLTSAIQECHTPWINIVSIRGSRDMGWVMMSERELNRVEVLSQVVQGRMSAVTAADVLALSRRQVHRLLKRFGTDGPAAILNADEKAA